MYGNKIRKFREEKNLSQEFIAEKTGMPQTSISTWERSEFPPIEFVIEALKILKPNMKLWEFFIEDISELDSYMPHWLMPEHLKFIEEISTLPFEKQKALLSAFIDCVSAVK